MQLAFFFRPTSDGSRQVVSPADETIAFCKFPELLQWKDLHAARFLYVLIIYSLPVAFVCNALFLFLPLYFHMYKLQKNLVNVCAQLISLRSEHFFGDTFDVFSSTPSICCVFIGTNPNQTSILGSGGNLQLPRAKNKLIEVFFKSCRACWHGPAPLFEV